VTGEYFVTSLKTTRKRGKRKSKNYSEKARCGFEGHKDQIKGGVFKEGEKGPVAGPAFMTAAGADESSTLKGVGEAEMCQRSLQGQKFINTVRDQTRMVKDLWS